MEKEADLIIKYILAQIDIAYTHNNTCDCEILPIEVTEGILEITSNCDNCDIPKFYVDYRDGNLYSEYNSIDDSVNLNVEDNNLVSDE